MEDEGLSEIMRLVCEPTGTDMGDYWISFLEMIDSLIQNIHNYHVRILSEYLSSTYEILKYLFPTITKTMESGFLTVGHPYHPFLIKDTNSFQKIFLSVPKRSTLLIPKNGLVD